MQPPPVPSHSAACCFCDTHLIPVKLITILSFDNIFALIIAAFGVLTCSLGVAIMVWAPTVLQEIASILVITCGLLLLILAMITTAVLAKTIMICPGCGRQGRELC